MTRKKWLTGAACMVLIGCAVALFAQEGEPVDKKTYDAVKPGLTEEEIKKLIPIKDGYVKDSASYIRKEVAADGKGWFRSVDVIPEDQKDGSTKFFDQKTGKLVGWVRKWETETYSLDVLFNEEGKVRGRTLYKFEPARTRVEKMIDFVRDLW